MFVRKKPNKSGVISIQVITKVKGKSKLVKTIGSSGDERELKELILRGKKFIDNYAGQQSLDFEPSTELIKAAFDNITTHTEIETELLLGKIFDEIGFNKINSSLFRNLVISRLCYPVSKLRTSNYLFQEKNIDIPVHQIYRYLDKLHDQEKELIQKISYDHTL